MMGWTSDFRSQAMSGHVKDLSRIRVARGRLRSREGWRPPAWGEPAAEQQPVEGVHAAPEPLRARGDIHVGPSPVSSGKDRRAMVNAIEDSG